MPAANLSNLREDYRLRTLDTADVAADPLAQFGEWFDEALRTPGLPEPNAMALATTTADGRPSVRIVLLKEVSGGGFCFFTNYESRKGGELAANPWAALTFWWPPLQRQVRIEGRVEKLAAAESEAYFQSRPRASQVGAWASPQSRPVADRAFLEGNAERLENQFSGEKNLPLPPFWGGFRLLPDRIEFWQGRPDRLHDRVLFSKKEGGWLVERLAP